MIRYNKKRSHRRYTTNVGTYHISSYTDRHRCDTRTGSIVTGFFFDESSCCVACYSSGGRCENPFGKIQMNIKDTHGFYRRVVAWKEVRTFLQQYPMCDPVTMDAHDSTDTDLTSFTSLLALSFVCVFFIFCIFKIFDGLIL